MTANYTATRQGVSQVKCCAACTGHSVVRVTEAPEFSDLNRRVFALWLWSKIGGPTEKQQSARVVFASVNLVGHSWCDGEPC